MSEICWYRYKPVDTILIRGAEEDKTSLLSIFPPPPQTIIGAIRTAYLLKKLPEEKTIKDYIDGKLDKSFYEDIGKPSENPPFEIIGPIFEKNNEIYIPVPYTWFMDNFEEEDVINIPKNKFLKGTLIDNNLPIASSALIKIWPQKAKGFVESIGGNWIKLSDFITINNKDEIKDDIKIYKPSYFYCKEPRIGIALYDNRTVRESQLYSYAHFRLKECVSLVFGITKDISLGDKGIMKVGAEQRFGLYEKINYEKINNIPLSSDNSSFYMSLSYIPCEENKENLIVTDKVVYIGGWDLAKGFHKPLKAHYPPGSVFKEKVPNSIPVKIS
ncbi:MAG: type III-B CRISPR module-associated Cmr3 family protein [Brevinematia bacterium]